MAYYYPYTTETRDTYQVRQTQGYTSTHKGLDQAPVIKVAGIPIIASCDGVLRSGYVANAEGHYCIINDGKGIEVYTGHHSEVLIKSGNVKAGDVIAYFGSTGNSTGMHTHLQVKRNGTIINPNDLNLQYLNLSNGATEMSNLTNWILFKTTNTSPMNHRTEPTTTSEALPVKVPASDKIYACPKIATGGEVERNGVKSNVWFYMGDIDGAPEQLGWVSELYCNANYESSTTDCSDIQAKLDAEKAMNSAMRADIKGLSDKYPVQ